jgi:hypothetical protein
VDVLPIRKDKIKLAGMPAFVLVFMQPEKMAIDTRLHTLDALAVEAGVGEPAHRNVAKNCRRAFVYRLGCSEIWLAADAKKLYSAAVPDLLRRILNKSAAVEEATKEAIKEAS